jgi:hypothetical protein
MSWFLICVHGIWLSEQLLALTGVYCMQSLFTYLHRQMNSSFVTQILWIWGLSRVSGYFPLKTETANISETL